MLELRHVGYETDDNKEILHDVNLVVKDRFVAITGPNGGGKSTLAKIIAGIYQPTSGQILLDGVDITNMSITERANLGVSYAFQQPVRFKGLRVKDLLSLAAGKNTSVNEACSYLSEVGLCARDYIDREVNASLSGGELKRIEIAMVLARGTMIDTIEKNLLHEIAELDACRWALTTSVPTASWKAATPPPTSTLSPRRTSRASIFSSSRAPRTRACTFRSSSARPA